jgi:phosphoribosyl-AMP cyclohydrolase
MFKELETSPVGATRPLAELLAALRWNSDGLVPAVAQDARTREVLMVAWMNRVSLEETLATRRVCYWSRSRRRLWRKGEESGHAQRLVELRTNCDGAAILLLVDQTGPACHTNRQSCFYLKVEGDRVIVTTAPEMDRPEA